jgi:hypothetical protein
METPFTKWGDLTLLLMLGSAHVCAYACVHEPHVKPIFRVVGFDYIRD